MHGPADTHVQTAEKRQTPCMHASARALVWEQKVISDAEDDADADAPGGGLRRRAPAGGPRPSEASRCCCNATATCNTQLNQQNEAQDRYARICKVAH